MSCKDSTTPIDISRASVKAKCSSKCRYIYHYPKSTCVVHNKGSYLSIEHSRTQIPPVKYNSQGMEVGDIRIYTPSIHRYSNSQVDGEIIINHRGNTNNLLVCIPIKRSGESSTSTQLLQSIIDYTNSSAQNNGQSVTINLSNFSLQEFIPKTSFFSYEGTLPYEPCTGNYFFVVFHPSNGYISLSYKYISRLRNVINKHSYTTKRGPLLFYNQIGTGSHTGANAQGGIYIDCYPVGEKGEILYNVSKSAADDSSSGGGIGSDFDAEEFFSNPIVILIISFIGLMGIYKVTKAGWDKFKESKE